MRSFNNFHGPNEAYVLDLYDRFLKDPSSVDEATRAYFVGWVPPEENIPSEPELPLDQIVSAVNLAQAIREHGHLSAQIDPLGSTPPGDPSLLQRTYGLTDEQLERLPSSLVGGPVAENVNTAREALDALRKIYSSTIGYDWDHVQVAEERQWLRHMVESGVLRDPYVKMDKKRLLARLTRVEVFENFLHRVFPGKFRFSIEGLDVMVPMLDEIVDWASKNKIKNVLIGMAHRGRLNVLAHILRRPYAQILAEFKDPVRRGGVDSQTDQGWKGDVKYHRGLSYVMADEEKKPIRIEMAPNPSHLEAINPVIQGMARAIGTRIDKAGPPRFNHTVTCPIVIHGDAAFPGQGIVAETLNLSRLPGYRVGGTIHIIANNQLGFTTRPFSSRSTLYASDLARGFEIPIVHVNADDPVACVEVARLAAAYRQKFQKDFLIDLVGYRRYGHNEGDDPSFTQPLMYKKINAHPTVRQIWADKLVASGEVEPGHPEDLEQLYNEELQMELNTLELETTNYEDAKAETPPAGAAGRMLTSVSFSRLRELNAAVSRVPASFNVNSKLKKLLDRRETAAEAPQSKVVDWAHAEILSLASVLEDGIAVRMTGQDVKRGTFSHRHATLTDQETGEPYTILQHLPQARAAFEIRNSPLTENACIGFEYGYNMERPDRLVIWEAQYGDFINGAQTVIDEFLTSARDKWGQTPSLVLLLPHGYEGQGPDHSSGRLERFLDLAADNNIRIANCTTTAQYYHLLRRQALLLDIDPLPLVIMSPKSLLRNALTFSSLDEISKGQWNKVIDDEKALANPGAVQRLIFCSGKIAIDLAAARESVSPDLVAITRVEQIYPFPREEVRATLARYPNAREVIWMQEEPRNNGAWGYVLRVFDEMGIDIKYLGRPRYSSPAEGSAAWAAVNQKQLIAQAFEAPAEIVTQKTA